MRNGLDESSNNRDSENQNCTLRVLYGFQNKQWTVLDTATNQPTNQPNKQTNRQKANIGQKLANQLKSTLPCSVPPFQCKLTHHWAVTRKPRTVTVLCLRWLSRLCWGPWSGHTVRDSALRPGRWGNIGKCAGGYANWEYCCCAKG
jgi:hypothetical protein